MIRKKSVALPLALLLSVGYAQASEIGKPATLDTSDSAGEKDTDSPVNVPSPTSPKSRRVSLTDTMKPMTSEQRMKLSSFATSGSVAPSSASGSALSDQTPTIPHTSVQPKSVAVSPTSQTVSVDTAYTPNNIALGLASKDPKSIIQTIDQITALLIKNHQPLTPTSRKTLTTTYVNLSKYLKEQKQQSLPPASTSSSSSTSVNNTQAEEPGLFGRGWNSLKRLTSSAGSVAHRRFSSMAGTQQNNTQIHTSTK